MIEIAENQVDDVNFDKLMVAVAVVNDQTKVDQDDQEDTDDHVIIGKMDPNN